MWSFIQGALLLSCVQLNGHSYANELHEEWNSALGAAKKGNYTSAAQQWEDWLHRSGEANARAETHFNLGVCYSQLEDYGNAIYHAILAGLNRYNPVRALADFAQASEWERQVQRYDSLLDQIWLKAFLLANSRLRFALVWIAFSLVAVGTIFSVIRTQRVFRLVLFSCSFLLAAPLIVTSIAKDRFQVGVLAGREQAVEVFRNPRIDSPITTLSTGSVAITGRARTGFLPIYEPFSGWVKTENILKIFPDH